MTEESLVWRTLWTELKRGMITLADVQRGSEMAQAIGEVVSECAAEDPSKVLGGILGILEHKLHERMVVIIFAYAVLGVTVEDEVIKRQGVVVFMPQVFQTSTDFFHWVAFTRLLRGTGRGFRRQVAAWYAQPVDVLAPRVKTRRRVYGLNHRDVLRMAHVKPASDAHAKLFQSVM